MSTKANIIRVATIMLLLLSLIGCTQQSQITTSSTEATTQEVVDVSQAEKILKVGIVAPFSGPNARAGEEMRNSITMAFEEVNFKVGSYRIEPVWIDSQSDPEKATRAYEEAIVKDGIEVGFMNWHSSVAVALMDVCAKYKIPHFMGMGATEQINEKYLSDTEKYGYWTTKGWPTPALLSRYYVLAVEELIAKGLWTPDTKTVAIYGEDTDYGRSYGQALETQFIEAGWDIKAVEYFPVEQTEFLPIINKFKEQEVALVAGAVASAPPVTAFLKQSEDVGLESLIIADGLAWVGEWYELTGSASNYVLDQLLLYVTDKSRAWADKYIEKYGFEPSPVGGAWVYDETGFFIKLLKETLSTHGEINRETIYDVIKNKVWTGELTYTEGVLMKEIKFTPESVPDMMLGAEYFMWPVVQYYDGNSTIIWPENWKNGDFKVPER